MTMFYNALFALATLAAIFALVRVQKKYRPSLTWFGFFTKDKKQRPADIKGTYLNILIVVSWLILLTIRMSV